MKDFSSLFTSGDDVDLIHEKTMYLLENKGVLFELDEAVELFKKHGCRAEGNIVFMKRSFVEDMIELAPKDFAFKSRGRKQNVGIGQPMMLQSSLGPVNVLDGGVYRQATSEDYLNFVKLHQGSEIIDLIDADLVVPNDVPLKDQMAFTTLTTLKYSDKIIGGHNGNRERCEKFLDLVMDFNDDHESCQTYTLATSMPPFAWNKEMLETIFAYAERGQCLVMAGVGLEGMTSPQTLAGTVLQNNVEILAGVVLSQLINPGTPIIYQLTSLKCDLRYSLCTCGGAETAQSFLTMAELAKFYGLPYRANGCLSDAKEDDYQSGMESFMIALGGLMTEPQFVYMVAGILDSYGALGYEKFILDEECFKIARHFLSGITVNEERLQMDKLMKIKHKDNYLGRTSKVYREDFYLPNLANREKHSVWVDQGSQSVNTAATLAWKTRVAEYQMPNQLEAFQEKLIRENISEEFLL
ncbi:trimethylamine methyltransferase family protein [Alkalibacter mobilis]|uniref:trimethylamine methyltransferase family protein n=1 Tax=Alkalibacter mobilis TaxID=2787712 RepID=UPI001CEC3E0A|nr:trimethylamine methyltransferase family protein [Alkalibacter mobilis]